MNALQIPGNAWTYFNSVDCFEPASRLIAIADMLADNFRYTHFRRRRSLELSRTGTLGSEDDKSRQSNSRDPRRRHAAERLALPSMLCFKLNVLLRTYFM